MYITLDLDLPCLKVWNQVGKWNFSILNRGLIEGIHSDPCALLKLFDKQEVIWHMCEVRLLSCSLLKAKGKVQLWLLFHRGLTFYWWRLKSSNIHCMTLMASLRSAGNDIPSLMYQQEFEILGDGPNASHTISFYKTQGHYYCMCTVERKKKKKVWGKMWKFRHKCSRVKMNEVICLCEV